ncbi:hypothetical protein [Miltoncostaea oceani]|uniref:hypothetical protein n=1 Tax=Miltoncostaea oceani TaxID=2843216 RepID=UPI001C3C87E7|nr:hypothetical protein [Miltoncostaea oceani]
MPSEGDLVEVLVPVAETHDDGLGAVVAPGVRGAVREGPDASGLFLIEISHADSHLPCARFRAGAGHLIVITRA